MFNYVKSEMYRIACGREVYLLAGGLCALVLAVNVLLFAMTSSSSDFPYATVRFSLSNLFASLSALFYFAGLLVWFLFADDRKQGVFKNAIVHGVSRVSIFLGKCIVAALWGIACMLVVLVVYISSAVLLLEGPAAEWVVLLFEGVFAALPSTVAAVVLAVAVCEIFPKTATAAIVWFCIVFALPQVLYWVGLQVEVVGILASWLPGNIFNNNLVMLSPSSALLWTQPFGWAKCVTSGFACAVVYLLIGLWRVRKVEL